MTGNQKKPIWLIRLPLELLMMVVRLLDLPSELSLALASKALLNTLYPSGQIPPLNKQQLVKFLSFLEKDNPTLVLCFDHYRLRPFDPDLGQRAQQYPSCAELAPVKWWLPTTPCDASTASSFLLPTSPSAKAVPSVNLLSWMPGIVWPNITFTELRSIMNRHLYGQAHGLPLQHLAYKYEFERFINLDQPPDQSHFPLGRHRKGPLILEPEEAASLFKGQHVSWDYLTNPDCRFVPTPSGAYFQRPNSWLAIQAWQFKHTSEARIINGELYLRRHHIRGPPVSATSFQDLLERIDLPICRHLRPSRNSTSRSRHYCGKFIWLPEIRGLTYENDIQAPGSCPICYTDYILEVKGAAFTSEWLLNLTIYHRFGSCKAPDDPIWQCAISDLEAGVKGRFETYNKGIMENYEDKVTINEVKAIQWDDAGGIHAQWHQIHRKVYASWWFHDRRWNWASGLRELIIRCQRSRLYAEGYDSRPRRTSRYPYAFCSPSS